MILNAFTSASCKYVNCVLEVIVQILSFAYILQLVVEMWNKKK